MSVMTSMTSMTRFLVISAAFMCGAAGCASRSAQPSGNSAPAPGGGTNAPQIAANTAPKLVVLLAVDQLRGEYR